MYAPDGREVSVEDASLEISPQNSEVEQKKAEKREQAGREYEAFRAKHLTGLSMCHAYPSSSVEWEKIAYIEPDTPGAHVGGDTWYVGQIDAEVIILTVARICDFRLRAAINH